MHSQEGKMYVVFVKRILEFMSHFVVPNYFQPGVHNVIADVQTQVGLNVDN